MEELFLIDGQGRKRKAIKVICSNCEREFLKQPRFVERSKRHYCCKDCQYEGQRGQTIKNDLQSRVDFICGYCKTKFSRPKSALLKSKTGNYFCCRECKDLAQERTFKLEALWTDKVDLTFKSHTYRFIAFNNYEHKCMRCGYDNIKALEVHHKDRNRSNNELENLEILCANCHSIEHKK